METRTKGDALQYARNQLLLSRNLHTAVNNCAFGEAYDAATDEQRKLIWSFLEKKESKLLSHLVRKILRTDLAELATRDLRQIAQELGIQYYSILPKASLLSAITQKEKLNEPGHAVAGQDGAAPTASENPNQTTIEAPRQSESLQRCVDYQI